ncbi:hypothetical protein [Umezawaea tangerina]|uniref:DUF1963 domain-containing protein n=1 Tax=Umezawaea tangerina TaxID=84725 RepID=A0A2T0SGX6_9PSEU|nr:hypothetical protein [Umezawaea tangerina]PRY32668.1 hypothetical protein CLV43_12087 [Umezawaea tangerina]
MRPVFTPSGPITDPVTKFGGQPVWLDTPTWPLSRELGTQMRFLGQIALPGERLVYLFMTEDEEYVDDTWEPEGGENACLVQPGPVPSFLRVSDQATGPTYGPDFAVDLMPTRGETGSADNLVGGYPEWVQNNDWPEGDYRFLAQFGDLPFEKQPNFGDAGTGYAFVDEMAGEGRFLWQCH